MHYVKVLSNTKHVCVFSPPPGAQVPFPATCLLTPAGEPAPAPKPCCCCQLLTPHLPVLPPAATAGPEGKMDSIGWRMGVGYNGEPSCTPDSKHMQSARQPLWTSKK
jgi:hypothetical protein